MEHPLPNIKLTTTIQQVYIYNHQVSLFLTILVDNLQSYEKIYRKTKTKGIGTRTLVDTNLYLSQCHLRMVLQTFRLAHSQYLIDFNFHSNVRRLDNGANRFVCQGSDVDMILLEIPR